MAGLSKCETSPVSFLSIAEPTAHSDGWAREASDRAGVPARHRDLNVRRSISHAARDLKVLGRVAIVPGFTAGVIALGVLVFALLWSTDSGPVVPWFGTALGTWTVAAIALGWFATRVRSGSTLTIGSAAATFSLGVLLLVVWRSRTGDPAIVVALIAFVPTVFAASTWWALHIARRLHSRAPECLSRPHATRRLSLPRDARALRAVGPALLGCLQVFGVLAVAAVLAPLGGQQQGLAVGIRLYLPDAFKSFRRVRAVLAVRAEEVRLEDRRLPVLLLRSFADDELAIQRTNPFVRYMGLLSLEEQIVAQLWEVGPVVAIGQPALEIDPIGAARERIVGPLWQPRVQALIEESALVVVVLGQTEGLFWEYEQLSRRHVSVLAILPPRDADVLADLWQHFTAAYPPARSIALEVACELPLLVWFRADHEPLIVSGQPRDERSYKLAFALWSQNCT
jgi:hypothetical protein